MELANGYKVVKVNDKSAIAKHDGHIEKFFDPTSIFYTEARAWGFSGKAGVDGRAENLAASVRKFERGEKAYQQDFEHGYILPSVDSIEQAGYDFAKEVQAKRELTIAALLRAKAALSKQEEEISFGYISNTN